MPNGGQVDWNVIRAMHERLMREMAEFLQSYYGPWWSVNKDRFATSRLFIEHGIPWGPVDPSPILEPVGELVKVLVESGALDTDHTYDLLQRDFTKARSYLPIFVSIVTAAMPRKKRQAGGKDTVLVAIERATAAELDGNLTFAKLVDLLLEAGVLDKKQAVELRLST